jgi:hypothetical protein
MALWRDFGWWIHGAFAPGIRLDRTRMIDETGAPCEVVCPKWWNLRRWWIWVFRCNSHAEFTLYDSEGYEVFLRVRTRPAPLYKMQTLRIGTRTLVPQPPDLAPMIKASEDPYHRLVADDVLERGGITHRDE